MTQKHTQPVGDELRETIANILRTGHYGIAETKVITNLLLTFKSLTAKAVETARIDEAIDIRKNIESICCVDKAWGRLLTQFNKLIEANQSKEQK